MNILFVICLFCLKTTCLIRLTLLHSEWQKLYGVLAILSAIGLKLLHASAVMVYLSVTSVFKCILNSDFRDGRAIENDVFCGWFSKSFSHHRI